MRILRRQLPFQQIYGSCRHSPGAGTVPPTILREALRTVRVVLDPMQTGAAIRTYNIMLGERRRVAAALIAVP